MSALKRIQKVILVFMMVNIVGTNRSFTRPACELLCWALRRQRLIPLVGDYSGSWRLSIHWRSVFPEHPLPDWLPVQTAQNQLRHQDLPPQHQQQRRHLSRHPQGPVVTSTHYIKRYKQQLILVLLSISSLLTDPNPDDPLVNIINLKVPEIAHIFKTD